jgi:DNA-binding CsgD family transcriptional regulator
LVLEHFAACCWRYAALCRDKPPPPLRLFGLKAGTAALVGFLCVLLSAIFGISPVLAVFGGILFGAGLSALGVGRGLLLVRLNRDGLITQLAVASIIASLIKLALLAMSEIWLVAAIVTLIFVASIMPREIAAPTSAASELNESVDVRIKSMAVHCWVLFGAAAMCLSVSEMVWMLTVEAGSISESIPYNPWGTALGSLFVALLITAARRYSLISKLQTLVLVIPLICVAFMVLTFFIGVWEEGLDFLGGCTTASGRLIYSSFIGFSTTIVVFLLVVQLCEEIKAGLSAVLAFGLLAATLFGFFLVFFALQQTFAWKLFSKFDLVMKTAYLLLAIVYLAVSSNKAELTENPIHEICKRFALSKREMEILELLVQGRSAPSIAKTKFIALSTVKTHIQRLYSKTGVHSREELLDLVYLCNKGRKE